MKVQNSIRIGSNHVIMNATLSKQSVFEIPEAIEVNERANKQTKSYRLDMYAYRKLNKVGERGIEKGTPRLWPLKFDIFVKSLPYIKCNMLSSSMFNMTNDICLIEPTKYDPNPDPDP